MFRIIGFIFVIWMIIFILGRISSRSGSKQQKQDQKKQQNNDPGMKDYQKNVIDGEFREVSPDEYGPEEKRSSDPLMDSIRNIQAAVNGIHNLPIREKAFRVLILARDIIHEHNEEHNVCRNYSQFESYYIPTLESVLENYHSMERKGLANAKVREDVLSYLESCEEAFGKLYNSMFDDDIMNMEVQMRAMNITLKRDGLL